MHGPMNFEFISIILHKAAYEWFVLLPDCSFVQPRTLHDNFNSDAVLLVLYVADCFPDRRLLTLSLSNLCYYY